MLSAVLCLPQQMPSYLHLIPMGKHLNTYMERERQMQLRPTVNPRRKPRLDKPKEEKTKGFSIEDIRNVILGKDANEQDKNPD